MVQPTGEWDVPGLLAVSLCSDHNGQHQDRAHPLELLVYRPFQRGGRFSAKASGPSMKSSLSIMARTAP